MARTDAAVLMAPSGPSARAALELLKPITWFPPMWAFGCGVVSSGVPASGRWALIAGGVALAGPLVCGTSQAVNDWFDREVDALHARMVWTHKGMTNWYRNPQGRVFAITPWRLVEYWKMTSRFDAAEYDMR